MRRQRGFTLIELMFAAAATAVVIWAATAFLLKSLEWHDELSGKIAMNRHARETFDVLAYGGYANGTGNDGTHNVYGFRGSNKAPPAPRLRANDTLTYTDNNITLTPDLFAAMTITCTGTGLPVPDCKAPGPGPGPGPGPPGPGGSQTVTGWLGSDVQLNSGPRSVANETVEVIVTITNPFEAQRVTNPALFTTTYRTIFTLNRNEKDP